MQPNAMHLGTYTGTLGRSPKHRSSFELEQRNICESSIWTSPWSWTWEGAEGGVWELKSLAVSSPQNVILLHLKVLED